MRSVTWNGRELPLVKPSRHGGLLRLVWDRDGAPVYVTVPAGDKP